MTELELLAIQLVAKVGLQAAVDIMTNIKGVKTIDDAIVALQTSAAKTWKDYKSEVGTV